MAKIFKGRPVADAICGRLAPRVEALASAGVAPALAIVRVGAREDDLAYERSIEKRFAALGLKVEKTVIPEDAPQSGLMQAIEAVNADASVHGCLLFRPLPGTFDEAAACALLDPAKDVDGVTPGSLYGVFAGEPVGFPPCTAEACVALLAHYGHGLEGANVAVVGRSLVIGRPVSMMLLAENATVTMCHTRTRDLPKACRDADVVVVAAGSAGVFGEKEAHAGQVVVDVGINWDESRQRLVGDVDFDAVEPVVEAVTPVPGGVGSVTCAVLASHVVEAAERSLA